LHVVVEVYKKRRFLCTFGIFLRSMAQKADKCAIKARDGIACAMTNINGAKSEKMRH